MATATESKQYPSDFDFDFVIILAHTALPKLSLHRDHHSCPNQIFSLESWTTSKGYSVKNVDSFDVSFCIKGEGYENPHK